MSRDVDKSTGERITTARALTCFDYTQQELEKHECNGSFAKHVGWRSLSECKGNVQIGSQDMKGTPVTVIDYTWEQLIIMPGKYSRFWY